MRNRNNRRKNNQRIDFQHKKDQEFEMFLKGKMKNLIKDRNDGTCIQYELLVRQKERKSKGIEKERT